MGAGCQGNQLCELRVGTFGGERLEIELNPQWPMINQSDPWNNDNCIKQTNKQQNKQKNTHKMMGLG